MKKRCRSFLLLLLLCGALCVGAQAAEHDMLKVGLKYGSTAMDEANLQNYSPFGGYGSGRVYNCSGGSSRLCLGALAAQMVCMYMRFCCR